MCGQLHTPAAFHPERTPVPIELKAGSVPDAVSTMKITINAEHGYRELTGEEEF